MGKAIYEQMQEDFINHCEAVENGDLSFIDCASKFREEMDYLNELADHRKSWLSEYADQITNEAEQYGKQGYKGRLFLKQSRTTYSFSHIPAWQDLENQKKAIEEKAKSALLYVQRGGLNVDENGEEIILPQVKVSSFLKVEKVK